jgi:membrane-associated phospholipid phosphatase
MSALDYLDKLTAAPAPPPLSAPVVWAVPLFALLAMLLLWLGDANRPLFLAINSITGYTGSGLWANITAFGDALAVFSAALLLVWRRPWLLWALFFSAVVSTVLVHGLKEWSDAYEVYRPPNYFSAEEINIIGKPHIRVSFPSGHTAAVFTLAAVLVLWSRVRVSAKIAIMLLATLVGISRIAVGVHWPMDVLGGAVAGWLAAVGALWLVPHLRWGVQLGTQRLFALLLVIAALTLVFDHDSGYAQARLTEILIGVISLLLALPGLRRLFRRQRRPAAEPAVEEYERPEEPDNKTLWGIAIKVVISGLIFGFIFRAIDLDGVLETWRGLVPRLLLLGVVFLLLSTVLAAYRWYLVMQPLGFGQDVPFYQRSYFKGHFFNQGLPTSIGGDAVRVLDVARQGFRKREALLGVAIDRGLGLAGLLLLNLLANLFNPQLLPAGVMWTLNALVAGGLLGFVALVQLRRVAALKRVRLLGFFYTLSEGLGKVLSGWRCSAMQIGLSVTVHLLSLLGIFLIGRSVGVNFDLGTFLVMIPPVILLTLIPVSLAGWGVREGAMIGLFTLIGGDPTAVLSMSILFGLVLIITSIPGLFIYLTGKYRI